MNEENNKNTQHLSASYINHRKQWEQQIQNYVGEDPLSVWFGYIVWLEANSFPSCKDQQTNVQKLEEILFKCLNKFEKDIRYQQDCRLVKLCIKYIMIYRQNSYECYRILLGKNLGSQVAEMYMALAYSYDEAEKIREADKAFRSGIAAEAQPLEVLKEAYQHYVFLLGQRQIYHDDQGILDDIKHQLQNQRIALSSLDKCDLINRRLTTTASTTAVKSLIKEDTLREVNDNAKKSNNEPRKKKIEAKIEHTQEIKLSYQSNNLLDEKLQNLCKAETKIEQNDISLSRTGKNILEPLLDIKPIQLPSTFTSKNELQEEWITPITSEIASDSNCLPRYNKFKIYPRPNIEFQPEEYIAYKWYQKRGIKNEFTKSYDEYWDNGPMYNVRIYPHFAKKSESQKVDKLDASFIPEFSNNLIIPFSKYYSKNDQGENEEYQWEELRAISFNEIQHSNETIIECADIDETLCSSSNKMVRKSFFPIPQKSCLPHTGKTDTNFKMPIAMGEKFPDNCSTTELSQKGATLKTLPPSVTIENCIVMETPLTSKICKSSLKMKINELCDDGTIDEANTTHAFNVLLKSQLVSTPKVSSNTLPLRITKDLNENLNTDTSANLQSNGSFAKISTIPLTLNPNFAHKNIKEGGDENLPAVDNQLSTILETSEHASSQATQNTHGSTGTISLKSIVNSLNMEAETANEFSANNKIQSKNTSNQQYNQCDFTIPDTQSILTPYVVRCKYDNLDSGQRREKACLKFPIFEDTAIETNSMKMEAGNFTRMQESTTDILRVNDGINIPALPIQMETDKTVPNIRTLCITPVRDINLCKDKMETGNKFLMSSQNVLKDIHCSEYDSISLPTHQEEIIPPEEPSVHMTCSKLSPKEPISKTTCNRQIYALSPDNTFDFFLKTSPLKMHTEKDLLKMNAMNTQKLNRTRGTVQFEDEIDDFNQVQIKKDQLLSKDTSLTEFFLPETQPERNNNPIKAQNRNTDDISFMADFSMIANDQNSPPLKINNSRKIMGKENLGDIHDNKGDIKKIFEKESISRELFDKENQLEDKFARKSGTRKVFEDNDHSLMATFTDLAESPKIMCAKKDKFSIDCQVPPDEMFKENFKETVLKSVTKFANPTKNFRKIIGNDALAAASSPNSTDGITILSETDMFSNDISMIKNSTWLPNHGPMNIKLMAKQRQEQKFNLKDSQCLTKETNKLMPTVFKNVEKPTYTGMPIKMVDQYSVLLKNVGISNISKNANNNTDSMNKIKNIGGSMIKTPPPSLQPLSHLQSKQQDYHQDEMSIYYVRTPTPPRSPKVHIWEDSTEDVNASINPTIKEYQENYNDTYKCIDIDINQTQQLIERMKLDPYVNPFKTDLINAFLDSISFMNYIQNLSDCMVVERVKRILPKTKLNINNTFFEITKLVGEGTYGTIYCGKNLTNGQLYALKQERPANLWEYYICLEIQDRIRVDELLPAFMCVDYALIGKNSSVLVSKFSLHGSLIAVCNKIKKITMKNVDEYVVMVIACELLEVIDHLHSVSLIHADIKADNFILMRKLQYPTTKRSLQLIDFGVAIDMKLFDVNQTFNYVHKNQYFNCIEMREHRPWTYQIDLYGLASVIHVLLFGKYMDVEKNLSGIWMHKTSVPRYFNRQLWDNIFRTLLNVIDCKTMPNLQHLRALLKSEIEERHKYVKNMIDEFNRALIS